MRFGSVGWAPYLPPKCCSLHSQSGHRRPLWAQSPATGVQEAMDQCLALHQCFCFFLLLHSSLSQKINTIYLKYNKLIILLKLCSHYQYKVSYFREKYFSSLCLYQSVTESVYFSSSFILLSILTPGECVQERNYGGMRRCCV